MTSRTVLYFQNANERWAQRRCSELGIPYTPLWKPVPHVTPKTTDEQEEVILQWARMNPFERELWGEKYPELRTIPDEIVAQESDRQRRMWITERNLRSTEPQAETPREVTQKLTSAAEVAEAKRRNKRRAS